MQRGKARLRLDGSVKCGQATKERNIGGGCNAVENVGKGELKVKEKWSGRGCLIFETLFSILLPRVSRRVFSLTAESFRTIFCLSFMSLRRTMALKTSTLDGGIGLIEARGSLVGGDETDELRQAIAGFVAREYSKLIIDLSGVTFLNSTAIGVLVSAQTTYARRQWQVKLCGINKNIDNIFVITKLTLVFDVHEKKADAVKSFIP